MADALCSPFDSHTDKARVIYTWLHHNIAYNVADFFGGCIKGTTPAGTIQSGVAVCDGYGGLFVALALAAGIEAVKVTGHGKGSYMIFDILDSYKYK